MIASPGAAALAFLAGAARGRGIRRAGPRRAGPRRATRTGAAPGRRCAGGRARQAGTRGSRPGRRRAAPAAPARAPWSRSAQAPRWRARRWVSCSAPPGRGSWPVRCGPGASATAGRWTPAARRCAVAVADALGGGHSLRAAVAEAAPAVAGAAGHELRRAAAELAAGARTDGALASLRDAGGIRARGRVRGRLPAPAPRGRRPGAPAARQRGGDGGAGPPRGRAARRHRPGPLHRRDRGAAAGRQARCSPSWPAPAGSGTSPARSSRPGSWDSPSGFRSWPRC